MSRNVRIAACYKLARLAPKEITPAERPHAVKLW